MRILHIASFRGNVGDNANHAGLRSQIDKHLSSSVTYENIEIRRAYQNYQGRDPLRFDADFAAKANEYDLVIFGGGNFFEIWLEDSATGCTIDIDLEILDSIKTPIVFFGLGFDTYKGYTEKTKRRFKAFLHHILQCDRRLVTVRNDGSIKQLLEVIGPPVSEQVIRVPDGGFFLPKVDPHFSMCRPGHKNIVLSIACDMLHYRFPDFDPEDAMVLLRDTFAQMIVKMASALEDAHFIMVPHIYSDVAIMAEVLAELPDRIRREQVSMAPYVTGPGAEETAFASYADASLVMSMRFHGNVVPLGMNVPVIGVATYPKIRDLFEELEIESHCVPVSSSQLIHTAMETIANPERGLLDLDKLRHEMQEFGSQFSKLISK